MKLYIHVFEKNFRIASDNRKYLIGINKFKSLFNKYPEAARDHRVLSRLGLLYDHLALIDSRNRVVYERKAFQLYRKALKLNADSYQATWGIGRVWWHRKNKKALPFALKALRLIKKSGQPYGIYVQNIGLIYESLGDKKAAEKWLLKGITVEPKNWAVYLNIINFYSRNDQIKKLKKYSSKLETFIKKEPNNFFKTIYGKTVLRTINKVNRHQTEG